MSSPSKRIEPAGGRNQALERAQERALARAVRAEHRDQFVLRDGQVEALDRVIAAIADIEVRDLKQHGRSPVLATRRLPR